MLRKLFLAKRRRVAPMLKESRMLMSTTTTGSSRRSPGLVVAANKTALSDWRVKRDYCGPLRAAILDWSGTCADNWVIAPARAFVEVFADFGVPITMDQARGPMGLHKRLHIKALLQDPVIAAMWSTKHGSLPNVDKVTEEMFQRFVPIQLSCLPEYCKLIPGTAHAIRSLKRRFGLKIGATTGFTRDMVDVLLAGAKAQGYVPDVTVAGDEVFQPRPFPNMVWRNMALLDILNVKSVMKVDDTVSGVQEGLNAGCWAVGLYETSNYMNINKINHGLSKKEFAARAIKSRDILVASGAHYVAPDITHLPRIVADINRRLRQGESP